MSGRTAHQRPFAVAPRASKRLANGTIRLIMLGTMSPARAFLLLAVTCAAACSSDEGTDDFCSADHQVDDVEESVGPDGQVVVSSSAPQPAATSPSGY